MFYRFLPLLVSIITILVTSWISILPLNWVSQADISNKYPTFITPSGFTFSIWSIIYLSWIIVSVMIALWKLSLGKTQKVVFSLSIALTAFWLLPWHYDRIYASLIVILMILAGFSYLFLQTRKKETPRYWTWMVELTYGWIICATLLNLAVYIVSKNIISDSYTMMILSLLWLFVGSMIQIALLYGFKSYLTLFVYVWALWWIFSNQSLLIVKMAAILLAIILLLNYVYARRKVYEKTLAGKFCKKEEIKPKKRK